MISESNKLDAAMIAIFIWVIKEIFTWIKSMRNSTNTDIKELTKNLGLATIAIVKLETKIELLTDSIAEVKQLRKDVSRLGAKIRN